MRAVAQGRGTRGLGLMREPALGPGELRSSMGVLPLGGGTGALKSRIYPPPKTYPFMYCIQLTKRNVVSMRHQNNVCVVTKPGCYDVP